MQLNLLVTLSESLIITLRALTLAISFIYKKSYTIILISFRFLLQYLV